jgi:hypothetical protein
MTGVEALVDTGRGYPDFNVGANVWNQQPPVCERSFISRHSSGPYQAILDDEMRLLCRLTPGANDPNWGTAFSETWKPPVLMESIPEGTQDAIDKGYDEIRSLVCDQMDALRSRNSPFRELCSGTLFSSGVNWSSPTISGSDLVPYCGLTMAQMCTSSLGNRFTTTDTTEVEEDCALAAWNAACFSHRRGQRYYVGNVNDLGYNQEAFGLFPFWCACSCMNACNAGGYGY